MTIIVNPWISGIVAGYLLFCGVCCAVGALRWGQKAYRQWKAKRTAKQCDRLLAYLRVRDYKIDMGLLERQWAEYMFQPESRSDTPAPRSEEREVQKHYSLEGEAQKHYSWRNAKTALAWGAIFPEEDRPGMAIHVQAANGHVLTDTTEWWMLQDIRREWHKSPGGFSAMYGHGPRRLVGVWTPEECEALKHYSLKGIAAQYLDSLHEAEKEWLFPRTVTFHPRYEVIYHLDGETWIWNQERFDWTVE